jgi:hypothetical protein
MDLRCLLFIQKPCPTLGGRAFCEQNDPLSRTIHCKQVQPNKKESFLIGQISQNHRQSLITRNSLTSLNEKRIQLFDNSGMLLVN